MTILSVQTNSVMIICRDLKFFCHHCKFTMILKLMSSVVGIKLIVCINHLLIQSLSTTFSHDHHNQPIQMNSFFSKLFCQWLCLIYFLFFVIYLISSVLTRIEHWQENFYSLRSIDNVMFHFIDIPK